MLRAPGQHDQRFTRTRNGVSSTVAFLAVAGSFAGHAAGVQAQASRALGSYVRPRVINNSFELSDASGRGPQGWRFIGAGEAARDAWSTDGPASGRRALRLNARFGSQAWESEPVRIRPAGCYLLRWMTRFRGEKAWRFRASFCGVEVTFFDERGAALGTRSQHSSCWQTTGWRPAWFLVCAPERAESALIRVAVKTDAGLPGEFDVDEFVLEPRPLSAPTDAENRLLTLVIRDEHGQPTAARVRLADSRGTAVHPSGAVVFERCGGAFHPAMEGACRIEVPPGRYTVTVTRGFEYAPWTSTAEVADSDVTVRVAMSRAYDWRSRGWCCGDHHTHLYRHGGSAFPSLVWRDVLRVARGEGLDFLPFMGRDRYNDDGIARDELRRPDFVAELTDEVIDDFWGHVCPIGVPPVLRGDPQINAGPMNLDRDAVIAAAGGALCYGHPYGPLSADRELDAVADPKAGLIAREFPIDLALGMPCGFDLLTTEGAHNRLDLKLRDLYRLYNLGFRPALAASTDFHVDQGRQPIGAVRTYVQSGTLDLAAVARAYRSGRTFSTNGPLVDLRVAGAGPGDERAVATPGGAVDVSVEAVSIGRLDRVEIIVNGRVARTFPAGDPHRITGAFRLPVRESTWIAAKVLGLPDPHLAGELEGRPLGAAQIAQTSPVYVIVAGRPVLAAEPADADYFMRWCDAVHTAWRLLLAAEPERARDDPLVTDRIRRAKAVFAALEASLSGPNAARRPER